MNKVLIIASIFFLALTSCEDEASSTDNKPTPGVVQKSGTKKSPAPATKLFDVGQEHLFTVLAREYWVYEFYINAGVAENNKHTGDWFHFNPDGTFTSGRWTKETGSGVWKLSYIDGKNLININSTDDKQDVEFEIQINAENTAASWVGTAMYPDFAQVMLKIIPLSSMPTEKQFNFNQ